MAYRPFTNIMWCDEADLSFHNKEQNVQNQVKIREEEDEDMRNDYTLEAAKREYNNKNSKDQQTRPRDRNTKVVTTRAHQELTLEKKGGYSIAAKEEWCEQ